MDTSLSLSHINSVISDLIEFVKHELERNGITVYMELDPEIPEIYMDEKYVKQALLNIIKNAEAAMPGGGDLTIKTFENDGFVHVHIKDTGSGISEENMTKIFEPYFTTKDFGSGLGLTVVYKIVKEHGGEIFLESKEGEGTTFILNFPIPQKDKRLLDWKGDNEI